jgi:hypothetical protein
MAAASTNTEIKSIFTKLADAWRRLSVTNPSRPETGGIHQRLSATHGR